MRINFLCNEVFDGWEPTDKRLGGTEESIVRWAEELERRGHEVVVYYNPRTEEQEYDENSKLHYIAREAYINEGAYEYLGNSLCINVKSSEVAPKEPTLYLTNEVDADTKDLSHYEAVIFPSEWALENIPVNNPRKFILAHGYDETKINTSQPKINKQCLYASSPDRGLETLEQIWPSVVNEHPDAQLIVTYGGKINTPNTTCGEFTEEEMNNLFNTSDIWIHPCSGGELYGISGIKAQAAGAIPVYFPTMALAETVKGGVACTDARDMYNTLCELLGNQEAKDVYREELAKIKFPTWKDSTDRLEEIIESVLE